jgi:hypothetical protein
MENFVDGSDVQINNNFSVALGMIKFAQISDQSLLSAKSSSKKRGEINFFKKTLNWIEDNL